MASVDVSRIARVRQTAAMDVRAGGWLVPWFSRSGDSSVSEPSRGEEGGPTHRVNFRPVESL